MQEVAARIPKDITLYDPSNCVGEPLSFEPFSLARRLETPIWVFDIDRSRIAYANRAACALWHAEDEAALCARDMSQDMSPTVAKRMRQYRTDFIGSKRVFNEIWTLYPGNVPTTTTVMFSGFRLQDGRMAMLCETAGAINLCPRSIRSNEALLHTDVMIALYREDGPAVYMNPAARNSAASPSQPLLQTFAIPEVAQELYQKLELSGECRMVAQVVTAHGNRWHDLSAKSCRDAVTGAPSTLLTSIDVSDLKEAQDRARFLADRDPLTGCFNRSYLQKHVAAISASDPKPSYAFIYFDVDHFKRINDRFGHEAGDEVLRQIVFRVRNVIKRDDVLARFGGDEFGILIKNAMGKNDFETEIKRIQAAASQPVFIDTCRIDVSVSMGATLFSAHPVEFTKVMSEVDIALYAAKEAGRNRSILFDQKLGRAARERDLLERELRLAIQNRDFVLHYQPRVDARNGTVASVEALVRWKHSTRGLILPDNFIPLCEENGMIDDLGKLIVEMGCEQAIRWHAEGKVIQLSINISPKQFESSLLLETLEAFAVKPGFPTNMIELEITENSLIGDYNTITEKLFEIKNMGYTISIDDFGRGYSNLFNISKFPIECLKIDRSFIAQIPSSGPILQLILSLGKQIGATVVAEGVEFKTQLDWLRHHGCDQIQGFYFSPAQPLDALPSSWKFCDE